MVEDFQDDALDALLRELATTPMATLVPLVEGQRVGRFEIVRELGRGGFGVVYEGRDASLGRHAALKLIRDVAEPTEVLAEAKLVARLQHPNIVTLYDFGWHDDRLYLVLELLRGETLQDRWARGSIDPAEVVGWTVKITRGLVAAHGAGICHHDLKPSNVFLTDEGEVKILDFGIAALSGARPNESGIRSRPGTPGYTAPERILGEVGDGRSDLFSVGVMLSAALGPNPPVAGEASSSPIPRSLVHLVAALVAPRPDMRPASAAILLDTLLSIEEEMANERAVAHVPPVRYATSGGASMAYQVVGDGPFDLLLVPPFVSHLECWWDEPEGARFVGGLSKLTRLILFDKRGTGMSERFPGNAPPSLDERIADLRAVLDAVGSREAVLFGVSEGVQLSVAFAARHPQSTLALALYGGAAGSMRSEQASAFCQRIESGWGTGVLAPIFAPSAVGDARLVRWLARIERLSATPAAAAAILDMLTRTDVHAELDRVRSPTLVVHRAGDRVVPSGAGRALARSIAGARFVEQPGDDHLPMFGDTRALLGEIERFLHAKGLLPSRLEEPPGSGYPPGGWETTRPT